MKVVLPLQCPSVDERSLNRWADAYARAWEQADADAVVELFTPDASYRSSIFDEPHSGPDGIRAYWERATSSQSNVRVWMGDPLVDGDRSALCATRRPVGSRVISTAVFPRKATSSPASTFGLRRALRLSRSTWRHSTTSR